MKITQPTKTVQLVHKQTGEVLNLYIGDEVNVANFRTTERWANVGPSMSLTHIKERVDQKHSGKIIKISSTPQGNFITIDKGAAYSPSIYLHEIESIGTVLLEEYDVTIDESLGDYEVEINENEPTIMLSIGDLVDVTYTGKHGDTCYVSGPLLEVGNTALSVQTHSQKLSLNGATFVPFEVIQDITVLVRVQDNNSGYLTTSFF